MRAGCGGDAHALGEWCSNLEARALVAARQPRELDRRERRVERLLPVLAERVEVRADRAREHYRVLLYEGDGAPEQREAHLCTRMQFANECDH